MTKTRREIALDCLHCFGDADIEGLGKWLADDLRFRGPFLSVDRAFDYLETLRQGGLKPAPVRVLSVTEGDDEVALFYEYGRGVEPLKVAQLFRFRAQKVDQILLVFDGRGLE
jgi:hypothetical protein